MRRPQVLLVCTANQCRSPMAEFLFRSALADIGLDWDLASAGTEAVNGVPMDGQVRRLLDGRGLMVPEWRSRNVTAAMLKASDLVLTATRRHRGVLVQSAPEVATRTFPLLQFSRLVSSSDAGPAPWDPWDPESWQNSLSALSEAARSQPPTSIDDLPDPVGQSYRHFRRCGRVLDRAITTILADSFRQTRKPVLPRRR